MMQEERVKEQKNIFEKIRAETLPNILKNNDLNIQGTQ